MNLRPAKTAFSEAEHIALRTELKAIILPPLTQAEVSRQAEVGSSTLSQYLKGSYPGDNDAVAAQLHKWLEDRKRAETARERFPVAPDYQPLQLSEEIWSRLVYARRTGRMISICGNPGVSKTSTSTAFRHQTPRTWLATMDPSTRGVNTCLVEILLAMGESDARGTPQQLSRRVSQRAEEAPCLIIIDEAQHLSDQSIEQLRSINDRARAKGAKVGIALVGNQQAYGRTAHDGTRPAFAQVSSRMAERMWIVTPHPQDVSALGHAWATENDEVLTEEGVRFLQAIATKGGGLRNVEMTMDSALMAAWGAEQPLDIDHLRWAYGRLSGGER